MKTRRLIATVALMVLFSACSKDSKNQPELPDTGMISLTTNWNDRTDGVAIPSSYKVSVGDFKATLSGESNEIDNKFAPGTYDILVYNEADKVTINDAVASVKTASAGGLEPMPEWFFTSHQTLKIEADSKYTVTATMSQQVRELTLSLTPKGSVERIARITATLNGVGSKIDMKSGAVSEESSVKLIFEKKGDKYEATMRLVGIVGSVQKLTSTIEYTGGSPANSVVESDLSALLTNFNGNKKAPLTLGADVEVVQGADFTATITDWEVVERDLEVIVDPELDITHHFIDANFRAKVLAIADNPRGNGTILIKDVARITNVNVSSSNIASLSGIEYFTALTDLNCERNQLTSLDVSKNTNLAYLYCYDNQLTSLDVSENTALTVLNCNNNQLTSLDVSGCTALIGLYCRQNKLSLLDVSGFTALKELYCYNNQLTSLDVSKNTALIYLNCNNNQLTSLDVSKNTVLAYLHCNDNQLTSLNVSGCTALTDLDCTNNQLTSLNASGCTALTVLNCNDNQLTSLDVSKNTALTYLNCNNNQLTSLDVSGCIALQQLHCTTNQLTSLDVSKNTVLAYLHCNDNQLTSLDVSGCIALQQLHCTTNQLTSLDVSKNTVLAYLHCNDNQLTSLNVSGCTALTDLDCTNNQLTSLNASGCTALTVLNCNDNQLTSLDVSKNTALTYLNCNINKLTSLNVSQCIALQQLHCYTNQLTSLDVSKNTALEQLYFDINQLTSLDISKNTKLTKMHCNTNPGTFNGTEYKFKINVWEGFTRGDLPDPANSNPSSFARGKWLYTPEGGAGRTVTVEYVIPTR